MPDSEFEQLFTRFERTAFRLETLLEYRVAQESGAFASFLAGRPRPASLGGEWLELVSRSTAAGKAFERVRVVPHLLTPYLRFEFAWGYAHSAQAGERILVVESDPPTTLFADTPLVDFWLFDDEVAVEMDYDSSGRFRHAHEVSREEVRRYVECRARMKAASIPLEEYRASDQS